MEATSDDWGNDQDEDDPIDRKDSGTALTNEINPFKLLPPQFHALLNIPIHDYGNGTTYNPYDKFLVPAKNKFPLVSTGYANTKYQGRPTPQPSKTTTQKPNRGPTPKKHKTPPPPTATPPKYYKFKTPAPHRETNDRDNSPTTVAPNEPKPPTKFKTPRPYHNNGNRYSATETRHSTTTARSTQPKYRNPPQPQPGADDDDYDDDYDSEYEPPSYRPTFTTTTTKPTQVLKYNSSPKRPETDNYDNDDNDDNYEPPVYRPSYTTIRTTYDQADFSVQVSPKPFKAVHQLQPVGEVEEADIIYDYDDERAQEGEGILYVVDNNPAIPTTPAPLAVPSYPTVANRNPSFRPSAELNPKPQENFTPRPDLFSTGDFGFRPPYTSFQGPRPPFRFPIPERKNKPQQNSPPNILPLFRPNTNPTDEFQFIKHPQQVDYHRQAPQQDNLRGQRLPPARPSPGGIQPLPSAMQSPFSQISQKVASFFGRRAGTGGRNSESGEARSSQIDMSTKSDRSGMPLDGSDTDQSKSKSDRSGMVADESDEQVEESEEVEDGEDDDHPFLMYNPVSSAKPDSIKRSDSIENQPISSPTRQVMGIRADPESPGKSPPAFYVFTQRELETGSKPYLVVGPQYGPPPSVKGAELVHTVAAKPITPNSQRRSDGPIEGGSRPFRPNAIKFPASSSDTNVQTPTVGLKFPNSPLDRPRPSLPRKPFFPVDQLSPPRGSPQTIPPLAIPPQSVPPQEIIPQGIAPTSPGTTPPRIPMNPQKDVISALQSFHSGLTKKPTKKPTSNKKTESSLKTPSQLPTNAETMTRRPAPLSTMTDYSDSFSQLAPVKYSTIEQEDGKQIAVVHPSYVVTYKPGAPELIDLEAPFITSADDRQPSQNSQNEEPDYRDGFLPFIPDTDLTQ